MSKTQITHKEAAKLLSKFDQLIVKIGNEEFRYATFRRRGRLSKLSIFFPDKRVEERDIAIADIAAICKDVAENRNGTFWVYSSQE